MKLTRLFSVLLASVLLTVVLAACGSKEETTKEEKVVNVYTARHYKADEVVFKNFTKETGIKVNVVKGEAEELIERLKREGESTEADLFITVDGGILANAKAQGILQSVESDIVEANVPENLRDADNQWIGMATRARIIAYSKERVTPDQLSTYEDLISDQWQGKVLARSSTNLYNQSLLASFIELNGEEQAAQWAEGIVKNFARQPDGGDKDQARAIAAGTGDVAIMNTYYVGLMLNSEDAEEKKVAEGLGVFFPNQETTGTHVNISGIGLTKHAKHPGEATKLIEYITSVPAQEVLSAGNYEFPVHAEAKMPELLESWGEFKMQELDFESLGKHNKKAIELFNKSGWK